MVSEKEKTGIRRFVKGQLRGEPDLSTLTLGILKKQYLAEAGRESLSSEAKQFMKQVVEEELLKMQTKDDSESEPELKKPQKKRVREKEELESEDETESRAKKSRQSGSSSDSEDEQNCETGSQSKEQIGSRLKNEATKESGAGDWGKAERRITSDSSSDEERNESAKGGNESPSPEERVEKKANNAKNGETRGVKTSGGIKNPGSDEESESDADSKSEKSDKINDCDSSANEKEENVKKRNDSDSDSSSLPSLEEEKKSSPEKTKEQKQKKKKKTKTTDEKSRGPKDENKAVVRLKRYIALCGVRKNYKKLLDGCRSTKSKVAVLKKELEDLGVSGNPTIEKCKKIRLKREEAQELAELDVDNIITTEGRPKRRGTSAVRVHTEPPSYQRALNSDSDGDQKNDAQKGRRKISEWSNLHGIISDDADTD